MTCRFPLHRLPFQFEISPIPSSTGSVSFSSHLNYSHLIILRPLDFHFLLPSCFPQILGFWLFRNNDPATFYSYSASAELRSRVTTCEEISFFFLGSVSNEQSSWPKWPEKGFLQRRRGHGVFPPFNGGEASSSLSDTFGADCLDYWEMGLLFLQLGSFGCCCLGHFAGFCFPPFFDLKFSCCCFPWLIPDLFLPYIEVVCFINWNVFDWILEFSVSARMVFDIFRLAQNFVWLVHHCSLSWVHALSIPCFLLTSVDLHCKIFLGMSLMLYSLNPSMSTRVPTQVLLID